MFGSVIAFVQTIVSCFRCCEYFMFIHFSFFPASVYLLRKVGRLDPSSRREYRSLLPGLKINGRPLRAFTMSRGLPPRARRVVVEGWTPKGDTGVPPQGDSQEGEHSRGGRRGASSRIRRSRDPPLTRARRTPGGPLPLNRSRGKC